MQAPKKKQNPRAKSNRIIARATNEQMHVIMRNALANVAGPGLRGKLSKWVIEAAMKYRPEKKIGAK